MTILLNKKQSNKLKEYNIGLYNLNYSKGKFFVPDKMKAAELNNIWPNSELKLI